MSWFSGLVSAGYLLNRLATKARLSLGLPLTTSAGVTNWRQPSRSACCSMNSARLRSSFSCQGCKGQDLPWNTLAHKADGKLLTTVWSNATSPRLASGTSGTKGWGTHTNPCCCATVTACLAIFLSTVLSKLTCCQIFMLLELGGSKEVNVLPNGASPQWISQSSVNWRVLSRLAASTQWAHTWGVHMATDTVHALEIKIPGYPGVMGQW